MLKFKLTFLSLLLFTTLAFTQNTQPGGWDYQWNTFTNADSDLGQRQVPFDYNGVRQIHEVPAPGIHPRIYFGPDEIPELKTRLETTASGQAIRRVIHAYNVLLHRGYVGGTYLHSDPYGLDPAGNRLVGNAGLWDQKAYYYKLINNDPTVFDNEPNTTRHMRVAGVMAIEAFECLLWQGEFDPHTNMSYDDRSAMLGTAMANWANMVKNDPDIQLDSLNYSYFGGIHMAMAYDLNYHAMTTAQRDIVRECIAGALLPASWCLHNSLCEH